MTHDVRWYSPEPMWAKRLHNGARERLVQPSLLRFADDSFMESFEDVLGTGAEGFSDQLAGIETNRTEHEPAPPTAIIPMYQPAHQRYYLVTGSLVCRERGLPDRSVDTTSNESVGFVLRRLVTETSDDGTTSTVEFGWFGEGWRHIDDPTRLGSVEKDGEVVAEEEQMPMFPTTYEPDNTLEHGGGPRRLWSGLIPVARRETFQAGPVRRGDNTPSPAPSDSGATTNTSLSDPRMTHLETRVIGALRHLGEERNNDDVEASDVRAPFVYALLDLYEFLDDHLAETARWIRGGDWSAPSTSVERLLGGIGRSAPTFPVRLIESGASSAHQPAHWAEALSIIAEYQEELNAGERATEEVAPFSSGATSRRRMGDAIFRLDPGALKDRVHAHLDPLESVEDLPPDLRPPPASTEDEASSPEYVVRCVYERPNCPPFRTPIVSQPTRRFRLASFFDAGAPARPVNISLPSANVADLRKSSKGVTMQLGEELRNQAQRVQELSIGALDDGEIGESPGVNIGMICSLSIPIITICALILLLVIVFVLNIVFWWLPFFKICFPLPTGGD